MENKIFYGTLFCSLLVHLLVIHFFSLKKIESITSPKKKIEVVYQEILPKKEIKKKIDFKSVRVIKEPRKKEKVEFLSKKNNNSPLSRKVGYDRPKLANKFKLAKKINYDVNSLNNKRKIKIPLLKSTKITNIKYLSYNQSIREEIRKRAYQYVDHPAFQSGEIYLTFIISSAGALKQIKIIEEKTFANAYLREVGIKCIKDSSPFAPFPKDLAYPELTFNVIISFEVKK